jgi:anti-sigma-K factor RskA
VTCADFKEQVAAYALGALEPDERRAFDEHLREGRHEGCLDELARMEATAQSLAESLPPVKPGAHVWKRIEERLGAEGLRASGGGGGRRWQVLSVLVAAAAMLVIWLLLKQKDELEERLADADSQRMLAQAEIREQQRLANECRTELAKAKVSDAQKQVLAVLERKGTQLAQLGAFTPDVQGLGGNIVVDPDRKLAYLVGNGFKPEPGKTYQLWVLPDLEHPVPAGLVQPEANGTAVASFDPSVLDQAKAFFAVSLEADPSDAKPEKILLAAAAPKTP